MSYIRCAFEVGGMVIPIPEEFRKLFKFGDTAEKLLDAIGKDGKRVVATKKYQCTCPEKNGGDHCCILSQLGCDQVIMVNLDGKVKPFAGRLFRQMPELLPAP